MSDVASALHDVQVGGAVVGTCSLWVGAQNDGALYAKLRLTLADHSIVAAVRYYYYTMCEVTSELRLVRVGGAVVYSTCSLSPAQNDCALQAALQLTFTDHGIVTAVRILCK